MQDTAASLDCVDGAAAAGKVLKNSITPTSAYATTVCERCTASEVLLLSKRWSTCTWHRRCRRYGLVDALQFVGKG